jgi:hypothetical protein
MRCPHAACPTASGLRLGPDILPAGGTAASASTPRPVPGGGCPIDTVPRVIDDGAPGHFFAKSGRPYAAHSSRRLRVLGPARAHGVEPLCPCSLAAATCAAVE